MTRPDAAPDGSAVFAAFRQRSSALQALLSPARRGVLVFLALAAFTFWLNPPSIGNFWRQTLAWATLESIPYPKYYSYFSGRPGEICTTSPEDFKAVLNELRQTALRMENESGFPLIRAGRFMARFNHDLEQFFRTPCRGEWIPFNAFSAKRGFWSDSFRFLPLFSPSLWAMHALGLQHGHLILLFMAASWLGAGCLHRLAHQLTGSRIVALSSVGIALTLAHTQYDYWLLALFPPLWAGVALLAPGNVLTLKKWLGLTAALLLGGFPLMFIPPAQHKATPLLILLLVALAALLMRRFRAALGAGAMIGLLLLSWAPLNAHLAGLTGPDTAYSPLNTRNIALYYQVQGFGEFPNALGEPPGDFAWNFLTERDPLLRQWDGSTALLHSLPGTMETLHHEILRDHWAALPSHYWMRFTSQLLTAREIALGLLDPPGMLPWFHGGLMLLALLLLFSFAAPGVVLPMVPVLGVIAWQGFGVSTLFINIHIHNHYLRPGLFLIFTLTPVLAWNAARALRLASRRAWIQIGVALVALTALAVLTPALALIRFEAAKFALSERIHSSVLNPALLPKVEDLQAGLEPLRQRSPYPPGRTALFEAWVYRSFLERMEYYQEISRKSGGFFDVEGQSARALPRILESYRQALKEEPENPWTPVYARFMEDPEWPRQFRLLLERRPDHPYAAYMRYALWKDASPQVEGDRERFEAAQHALWSSTAAHRSGYRLRPEFLPSSHAKVEEASDGVRVILAPGESVWTRADPAWCSGLLTAWIHLRVERGGGEATLWADDRETAGKRTFGKDADQGYLRISAEKLARPRSAALRFTAGPEGAEWIARDYYLLRPTAHADPSCRVDGAASPDARGR
ncbi:MAG: hypothetical protein HQL51_09245 [Magnetococcales bacterium]|nr:hypothetical protein [Magnetococcales bacterium]